MGKRSQFLRRPQDAYDTPYSAVVPLLPWLQPSTSFMEPCAGANYLVEHLEKHGHKCSSATDIKPRHPNVKEGDLFNLKESQHPLITNPPWNRKKESEYLLHRIINYLRDKVPYSWLLLDADWAHTRQAAPYMSHCSLMVAVGRVKWIEGSKHTGKDNVCWYRIEPRPCETRFIPR